MKIVSPYRPFVPESLAHQRLGPFDWVGTLQLSHASAARAGYPITYAITDVDTDLPVRAHHYVTHHRRLMLWLLEVALCYLESTHFDQDTVWMSPDTLVYGDLSGHHAADLGIVVRMSTKFVARGRTVLNSVQFWRHAAQPRLVAFYQHALAVAQTLPENSLRWGADTDPLVTLLAPVTAGRAVRAGLTVAFIEERTILGSLTTTDIDRLAQGRTPPRPSLPLLDFRYLRKRHLAAFYQATIGAGAAG